MNKQEELEQALKTLLKAVEEQGVSLSTQPPFNYTQGSKVALLTAKYEFQDDKIEYVLARKMGDKGAYKYWIERIVTEKEIL